jgi:PAS domain S-box-containing protein
MKISTHLQLNIYLAVLSPLLIGVLLLFSYQSFRVSLQESAAISSIRLDINDLSQLIAEFSISSSPRIQQQIRLKHDELNRTLGQLHFNTADEKTLHQSLLQHSNGLQAGFVQIQEVLQARQHNRIKDDTGDLKIRLTVQLIDQIQLLRTDAARLSALTESQLADRHRSTGWLTLGTISLIAMGFFASALITRRRLGAPLKELHRGIRHTASGDLSFRLTATGMDELGDLAEAFNAMLDIRQQADEALLKLNRELELRVAERTEALHKTINGLEIESTERQQVENSLRVSEGLYRTLVENIDLDITLIDSDHRVVMTNNARSKIFQREIGDAVGRHCYEASWNSQDRCPNCPGDIALHSGKPEEIEVHKPRADGSDMALLIRAFPVFDGDKTSGFIEVIEDITERKQFEDQLAETRRQLQALMDNLPGMAYRCRNDADRTMEFVSEGSFTLTGYSAESLIHNKKRSYASLIHPDDQEIVWLQVQSAIAQHEPFFIEYRIVTASGVVRDVWEKGSAVFGADGDCQALEGFIMDITARKAAEEALRASEERLSRAVLDAPFPIMIHAEDGEVLLLSKAWTEISGYTQREIPTIGDWTERAYGQRIELGREFIENLYDISERRHDGEYQVTTKTGAVRIWDFSSASLGRTDDGRRSVISMATDVTERKAAEAALAESEARYRSYFETGQIGMAITSIEKGWVDISNRLCETLGYSREELQQLTWAELTHPDDLARDLAEFGTLLRGEKDHYTLEKRFIHKNRSIVDSFIAVTCVRKEDGRPDYFVALVQDLSQLKRTERSLAKTITELQRSNHELEQFAYIASHDLQEPLRMVGSYVQLLARRYQGQLDADADEFIGYAVEGATRMQQLINDLLAFSRAGRRSEPFAIIDCNEIINTVRQNLSRAIEESAATLNIAPLPQVMGNPTQLTQVFQNLLANALKFRGEAAPQVDVTAEKKGNEWLFAVRDNGIGIDPQFFDKVFIIFQRLHAKKDYPGTGIGLALSKKIIEQHGGRIWIESESGCGTTFFFTLKGEQST